MSCGPNRWVYNGFGCFYAVLAGRGGRHNSLSRIEFFTEVFFHMRNAEVLIKRDFGKNWHTKLYIIYEQSCSVNIIIKIRKPYEIKQINEMII